MAGYINIVALALSVFMLLSFAILPADKTRRHYLNVCLLVGIVFLQLGFIVPWAKRPNQCRNAITPDDMYSSMICAWGGVRLPGIIRTYSILLTLALLGIDCFWRGGCQHVGYLLRRPHYPLVVF